MIQGVPFGASAAHDQTGGLLQAGRSHCIRSDRYGGTHASLVYKGLSRVEWASLVYNGLKSCKMGFSRVQWASVVYNWLRSCRMIFTRVLTDLRPVECVSVV